MDEASQDRGGTPVEVEASIEQRWPIGVVLFTAWLCPATTARRTAHARLFHVWLVHFLALLLTAFAILACVAWSDTTSFKWRQLVWAIEDLLDEFILEASQDPAWAILIVIGGLLLIEIAHVVLALLFMPWGAKDEPLRASFRNALRRTWIQSTHFFPAVLIVGSTAVVLGHLEADWDTRDPPSVVWPVYPTPPNVAPDDAGYEQAMAEFTAADAEYGRKMALAREAWRERMLRKPWCIREPETLSSTFGFATGLWVLWALLRCIGAPRRVTTIDRPPMCTGCGYNLHTIAMDSRCPECGDPVRESLGPEAHPGAPWKARRTLGCFRSWSLTVAGAVLHPSAFGRRLPIASDDTNHRSFLAIHLSAIFLAGVVGLLNALSTIVPHWTLADHRPPVILVPIIFGCACVAGTVAVAHVVAVLVGFIQSLRYKRNLLPASMQMSAYLSGYLLLWAVFGAGSTAGLISLDSSGWLRQFQDVTGLTPDRQFILLFVVPNLAWGVVYVILVARGTAAARYANR